MTTAHTATRVADMAAALRRSRELDSHDGWSVSQLREYQESRLTDLVRHAVANSALYRELYSGIDVRGAVQLERLPSIDKTLLMERFDDVVIDPRLRLAELEAHLDQLTSDELYLGEYRVVSTGGSTGRKGIFVADRAEWREYLAGLLRVNAYMGLWPRLPRRRRVATVAASRALHVTYRMSRSLDVGLHRVLRLDASTPVEQLVEPLNRHRPEFLYSYPSVLSLLAVEQLEGRLEIAPTTIVSSGETHTADLVSTVRAAWDVPWFQIYGTTEVPTLGAHCSHHSGLHLFEDTAMVEVVDENDQPVPPGQTGHRMLVTNLVNRTQPLIRYAISDMVAVSPQPCPCGRPFRYLEAVEGRNDDILHLPAVDGGEVAVHPLALRSPMAAVAGLKQYRMLYDHHGLSVRVALRAGVAADVTEATIARGLRETLASLGATPLNVDVTVVERIDGGRDSAGKFKVIESSTGLSTPIQKTTR
jgi:phenylacetate-CoA ligase